MLGHNCHQKDKELKQVFATVSLYHSPARSNPPVHDICLKTLKFSRFWYLSNRKLNIRSDLQQPRTVLWVSRTISLSTFPMFLCEHCHVRWANLQPPWDDVCFFHDPLQNHSHMMCRNRFHRDHACKFLGPWGNWPQPKILIGMWGNVTKASF